MRFDECNTFLGYQCWYASNLIGRYELRIECDGTAAPFVGPIGWMNLYSPVQPEFDRHDHDLANKRRRRSPEQLHVPCLLAGREFDHRPGYRAKIGFATMILRLDLGTCRSRAHY